MQLLGEKLTRVQLEEKLGLKGKEATNAIRTMVERGELLHQLDHVDPARRSERRRVYFRFSKTMDMFA